MLKTITVSDSTWLALTHLKIDSDAKNLDSVIQYLLMKQAA